MVAVEVDEVSAIRHVRFDRLPHLTASSIKDWATKALHIHCSLVIDGYPRLSAVAAVIPNHGPVVVSP
jgi:hypothetical protein